MSPLGYVAEIAIDQFSLGSIFKMRGSVCGFPQNVHFIGKFKKKNSDIDITTSFCE
jgi:hypothetical protein